MQYSQEHLKTMVYAKFGGQTECIMGNWKIENAMFIVSVQANKGMKVNESRKTSVILFIHERNSRPRI